jgi:hypothetical protein
LGVVRSELATLLDSAKSDDGDEGSANTGDDEEPVDSNDGGEEPAAGVSQESEQEAESGGVNQSFTVTSSGDNSNQSVGSRARPTPATPRTRWPSSRSTRVPRT